MQLRFSDFCSCICFHCFPLMCCEDIQEDKNKIQKSSGNSHWLKYCRYLSCDDFNSPLLCTAFYIMLRWHVSPPQGADDESIQLFVAQAFWGVFVSSDYCTYWSCFFPHSYLYCFIWYPTYFDTQTLLVLSFASQLSISLLFIAWGFSFFWQEFWVSDSTPPPPETITCFVMQLFFPKGFGPIPRSNLVPQVTTVRFLLFLCSYSLEGKLKGLEPFCNSQQMFFSTKKYKYYPRISLLFWCSFTIAVLLRKDANKSNSTTKHRLKPTSLAVAGLPLKLPMTTFGRFLRAPPPPADLVVDCISECLTFFILKLHFFELPLYVVIVVSDPPAPFPPIKSLHCFLRSFFIKTIVTPCSLLCFVSWFCLTVGTLGDRIGFSSMSPEKKIVKINPSSADPCKTGLARFETHLCRDTVWCDTTVRMG